MGIAAGTSMSTMSTGKVYTELLFATIEPAIDRTNKGTSCHVFSEMMKNEMKIKDRRSEMNE